MVGFLKTTLKVKYPLLKHVEDYGEGQNVQMLIAPYYVRKAPTVEAIPIPKGATNGDIIKAMFPEVFVTNCKLVDKVGYFNFDVDWWNAPYKENENVY